MAAYLFAFTACTLAHIAPKPGKGASPVGAKGRPNIILVLTDDQRSDTIHALGNDEIRTPNLDRLVRRGFTFTNAYCQGSMIPAVCAPSRTMILTGKSLFKIPAPNASQYDGPTLGATFAAAGYSTLCVSKPGNSFGFAHRQFSRVVHIPHVGTATNQKCADAVIDFIESHEDDRPFFVYLAPSMPHDPRTAEPEYHRMYDPAKITLSRNFLPEHPFDNGELKVRDEMLAALPRAESEMKKHLADYYACVTSLDHHLGRVLEAIRKSGRLGNTVVVFTSDQGLAVGGRHGLMGKQNLYEHVKPPLILAGAGIPRGKSRALVYLFDLFPTLCGIAGIEAPSGLEGKSLVAVMEGKTRKVRDDLFGAYRDCQRMVRDDRWKLIWYPKAKRNQLFDLKNDPDEINDLSARPKHSAKLTEMKALLGDRQKDWGDPIP